MAPTTNQRTSTKFKKRQTGEGRFNVRQIAREGPDSPNDLLGREVVYRAAESRAIVFTNVYKKARDSTGYGRLAVAQFQQTQLVRDNLSLGIIRGPSWRSVSAAPAIKDP